jgi:type VI secretion system secreted protein Hcp
MRKWLVVLATVEMLTLLLSVPAHAGSGLAFYAEVMGEKQGKIQGSCQMRGREGTIVGLRLQYTASIATDAQTGLPAGKPRHQPVVITKDLDKSSPKLMKAFVTGEHLKEVKIRFYRIDPKGKEENYRTMTLEDAVIQSVRQYANALDPNELLRSHDLEDISLTFKRIRFTWEEGGIESEATWQYPPMK